MFSIGQEVTTPNGGGVVFGIGEIHRDRYTDTTFCTGLVTETVPQILVDIDGTIVRFTGNEIYNLD